MFDHVTFRASDRAASERFFETVLSPLDVPVAHRGAHSTTYGAFELAVAPADEDRPATRGAHLGIAAPSAEHVRAFWQAGVDAGYASDGEPGPRPSYLDGYYGAFLRDPDGNSVEACVHPHMRADGLVDHLWLRVADLPVARGFYAGVAEYAGHDVVVDGPQLVRLRGGYRGSITLLPGDTPTTGLHLSFPSSQERIDAFHAALTAAGHASGDGPGLRDFHARYYGAHLIDPDGNSVELVDHGAALRPRT